MSGPAYLTDGARHGACLGMGWAEIVAPSTHGPGWAAPREKNLQDPWLTGPVRWRFLHGQRAEVAVWTVPAGDALGKINMPTKIGLRVGALSCCIYCGSGGRI